MLKKNHFLITFFEYSPHVLANWILLYLFKGAFVYLFPNPPDLPVVKFIQFTFSFLFYGCIALTIMAIIAIIVGLLRKESIREAFQTVFIKEQH